MRATLLRAFLVVEVNLILWLVLFGSSLLNGDEGSSAADVPGLFTGEVTVPRAFVSAGFLFALVIQHWAYYAVYRKAKSLETVA